MIVPVLRVAAALLLAWGLWWAWRSLRADRAVALVVGLGLVARALGGAVLFWVSYLELPIGESLQLGSGFWFFALDGQSYFQYAQATASGGLHGIWNVDPGLPSGVYIQALALTQYLVGSVASASLLLNLGAYLATCLGVVWIARRVGSPRSALLLALGAVSLMPSWILWSTQPLKDTVFIALVVVYVAALLAWLDWLRSGRPSRRTAVASLLLQWVVLYGIAGVRWYFALIMLAALAVSSAWAVSRRPSNRLRPAILIVVGLLALAQTVPLAAEAYLPPWVRAVLRPPTMTGAVAALGRAPDGAMNMANRMRRAHVTAGGGTEIRRPADEPAVELLSMDVARTPVDADGERGRAGEGDLAISEKMLVGTVAMFVPCFVGEAFGWIEVSGGRGLFAFAEADTILLDVVALVAVVLVVGSVRRARVPHPAFWFVLMLTVCVALPLAYQASNFGTLFRQRNMVAVGVLLLPLFMTPRPAPSGGDRRTSDATART